MAASTHHETVANDGKKATVLVPPAEFCGPSAIQFQSQLLTTLEDNPSGIVIDMSSVIDLDALGLLVLARCRNSLKTAGRDFRIVDETPDMKELLNATAITA